MGVCGLGGRGAGRNHTGLKFPLLARRGRRRGGPRGKGRVGEELEELLTQAEGFGETSAGVPASTGANRCSLPSHGPGAGLGPWRRSEAALSALEVSALTQPSRDSTRSLTSLLPVLESATGA